MTQDEFAALAAKFREGKLSPQETVVMLDELEKHVDSLDQYLSTLPKKNI
jgi:hypothetical protein